MLVSDNRIATVLFGPSQYGKSSLVDNLLLRPDESKRPTIGVDGEGTSVTRTCDSYKTAIGLVQDNAGYNDTGLLVDAALGVTANGNGTCSA
jgi:putative ribosome biogenesis GTPase RsgA